MSDERRVERYSLLYTVEGREMRPRPNGEWLRVADVERVLRNVRAGDSYYPGSVLVLRSDVADAIADRLNISLGGGD